MPTASVFHPTSTKQNKEPNNNPKMPSQTRIRAFLSRHIPHIILYQVLMISTLLLFLTYNHVSSPATDQPHLSRRSWGPIPETEECNVKFRTATLLSLLVGVLGADQFYAHHWALAVFKLLTLGGSGIWAFIDAVLWIVGGIYGVPGCGGGYGG